MCRTDELKELLNAFVDGGFKTPPLCTAAQQGDVELVILLLDKVQVDKNSKDPSGDTPLILAARGDHMPVVEALLAAGVDVDTISTDGTALHVAAYGGFDGIIDALLKKGANTDVRKSDGETALMEAAYRGHLYAVKALLAAHADVDARELEGLTALHVSVMEEGRDEIVGVLLEAGAQKNASDNEGTTPLHIAAYCDLVSTVKTLVVADVDVNARDEDGITALHNSAEGGRGDTVMKTLLASGAEVNIATEDGDTALHIAVASNLGKAGEAGGDAGARSVKQRGGGGREGLDLVSVVAKLGEVEKDVFRSVVNFL
ncbi:conserved unknown protein [Ectocarpus siliculosus]|uniref:Uncharacterized protein n=1 Tax=Ectocarpus siliculosus TaxID=2880 RepID=D8LP40_ECTSI|nr:conserved unknown protein [Ectocarpus siliculosus]|eukprot:CBN80311.1 conserved unknown protein [Ectocarpus siliculosus]